MSTCDWRQDGFYPNPDDCTKWIRCFRGDITESGNCTDGNVASLDPTLSCANPADSGLTTCSDIPVEVPSDRNCDSIINLRCH